MTNACPPVEQNGQGPGHANSIKRANENVPIAFPLPGNINDVVTPPAIEWV